MDNAQCSAPTTGVSGNSGSVYKSPIYLNVREVKNGFVIDANLATHVCKTKEEVVALLTELLK